MRSCNRNYSTFSQEKYWRLEVAVGSDQANDHREFVKKKLLSRGE